jgi:hypothetical protein
MTKVTYHVLARTEPDSTEHPPNAIDKEAKLREYFKVALGVELCDLAD